MAIQLPDVGTGVPADKTGDSPWLAMKKVRENFNDQNNAASRLVGEKPKNLLEQGAYGIGYPTPTLEVPSKFGFYAGGGSGFVAPSGMDSDNALVYGAMLTGTRTSGSQIITLAFGLGIISLTETKSSGEFVRYTQAYTTQNTTKDVGTGFLKASSPVLHVYDDKIDKIHEAEQLDIVVDKKGVGHYEIRGTTGLRQNDGWNMSPPRDIHGNVRCMIEVTEKDDVITLKTYKRKFDLELAAIVHDYDNPLDIPDGACVELRFNDLPYENLDNVQVEV